MHSPRPAASPPDLILRGHSELIDASQLSVERFTGGKLLEETVCSDRNRQAI